MGHIIALDQNMVNMIAAGEVIERPASVVKELVENSIDAGATSIGIDIEDGGRKLISVTDNGCGMDAEDLASAFEPHTTSKIKTSQDLRNISTLGFRGEALASIASVAQVTAVTRNKEELAGSRIEIDCGQKGSVTPCSADCGTTIQIRDLFYKLPARRKFLKTANTELSHITEQFTRIALANPGLELRLTHNGRELYAPSAGQGIRMRISQLFSSEISESLLETQSQEKGVHIFALLGRPDIAKTSSRFQYVFINGRFIRDKFISHATKEAYRGSIEPNKFPVAFIFLEMPPEEFDVNVHPTKIEVRFYNANLVHSQILAALREKLLATDLDTSAKLPTAEVSADIGRDKHIAEAMAEFFKRHKPAAQQQRLSFRSGKDPLRRAGGVATQAPADASILTDRNFIQIHDSFIIAQTEDGFVIIDQHALHERIMYEQLRRRVQTSKLQSQKLLMPESFQLTDAHKEALLNNNELLAKLGIELVPFGPRTIAVQGFPTLLSKADPVEFVEALAELLADRTTSPDKEKLLDEVLNMAACKAAIKAGQKLTDGEIEQLLSDKAAVDHSSHCPHGRPAAIKFSLSELERQFKRT